MEVREQSRLAWDAYSAEAEADGPHQRSGHHGREEMREPRQKQQMVRESREERKEKSTLVNTGTFLGAMKSNFSAMPMKLRISPTNIDRKHAPEAPGDQPNSHVELASRFCAWINVSEQASGSPFVVRIRISFVLWIF
jgi:hypothetical protein